jgi:hypothetical protein
VTIDDKWKMLEDAWQVGQVIVKSVFGCQVESESKHGRKLRNYPMPLVTWLRRGFVGRSAAQRKGSMKGSDNSWDGKNLLQWTTGRG